MSQRTPTRHEVDAYCAAWILNGGTKYKAFQEAFPKSKASGEGLYIIASRFHKLPEVLKRLEEMQQEQAEKDEEEFDLSVSELKKKLKDVMDTGLAGDGSGRLNLSAVVSAVSEVNRMNGYHAASKIAGHDGGPLEIPERDLARRIAFTLAKYADNSTNQE